MEQMVSSPLKTLAKLQRQEGAEVSNSSRKPLEINETPPVSGAKETEGQSSGALGEGPQQPHQDLI